MVASTWQKCLVIRLTVFSENGAWQQGSGQCPVKAKSGVNVIFIQRDLLQVEIEDVVLVEVSRHKALQKNTIISGKMSKTKNYTLYLHIWAACMRLHLQLYISAFWPSCMLLQHYRGCWSGLWHCASPQCTLSPLQLAAPQVHHWLQCWPVSHVGRTPAGAAPQASPTSCSRCRHMILHLWTLH